MFTTSEKSIIKKIRKLIKGSSKTYNFWFVYDIVDVAINFEGGYELGNFAGFRNDYYIKPGKYQRITETPVSD